MLNVLAFEAMVGSGVGTARSFESATQTSICPAPRLFQVEYGTALNGTSFIDPSWATSLAVPLNTITPFSRLASKVASILASAGMNLLNTTLSG